jgi:hypothetical protein
MTSTLSASRGSCGVKNPRYPKDAARRRARRPGVARRAARLAGSVPGPSGDTARTRQPRCGPTPARDLTRVSLTHAAARNVCVLRRPAAANGGNRIALRCLRSADNDALTWARRQVSPELAQAVPGRLLAEIEVPCSLDDQVALAEERAVDDAPVKAHGAVVARSRPPRRARGRRATPAAPRAFGRAPGCHAEPGRSQRRNSPAARRERSALGGLPRQPRVYRWPNGSCRGADRRRIRLL